MDTVGLDMATLPRDFVSFVTLVVLGFLSASLLRNLSRTVIVGLLLFAVLVAANVLGLRWFDLDFLWRTIGEMVKLLPSFKDVVGGLMQATASPMLAVGYLIGLLIGLVGFRSLLL